MSYRIEYSSGLGVTRWYQRWRPVLRVFDHLDSDEVRKRGYRNRARKIRRVPGLQIHIVEMMDDGTIRRVVSGW